ncbi:MAG: tetratricopeptide repeat protein [Myxococcales bacterium]|nr:tetratricopeptide repeat protein [Myxococcales bacterium]
MNQDLSTTLARAFTALEAGDFDAVAAAVAAAREAGMDPDNANLLHLEALLAWATGEIDEAAGLFERALESKPDNPRIYIECAELQADLMDFDTCEHVLRSLLERDDLELGVELTAETLLLLAQSRLSHQDPDPEEALELLDQIDESIHDDPAWISVRAAALMGLERNDEGIALLAAAVEREDDAEAGSELLYQLGIAHRELGDEAAACEALFELRRRDLAHLEVDADAAIDADERDDLLRRLEDVLESLPDPILKLIATAPISVQRWVSEEQIRDGADPRTPVLFEGTPMLDEADGEELEEGKLDGIILFRDMLVAEIESDEEIAAVIAEALVEELERFFDIDGLVPGI